MGIVEGKKLKVLFIRTDFYGGIIVGGTASIHRGQIRALVKEGHSAIYASCGKNIIDESFYARLPDTSLVEKLEYYFIPYPGFLTNFPEVYTLPFSRYSAKRIKKIINERQPDFFIHHHSDFNYAGTLLKRKTGRPFVLHCDGVEQWVKKNWGRLYFTKLLKWTEEIQWMNADLITVPSEEVKKQIVEYGGDGNKILVNPNGVDPDFFEPLISGDRIKQQLNISDKFIVGYSGTFGPWHGVDILAKASVYLKKMIPDIFILFIGDGDLRHKIETIIKENGTEDICHITGLIEFSKMPEYMSACDVLVSPCVHNPNLEFFNSPIKLFEYMAMEKPVVASNIGQQGIVIDNEINGLLCEPDNPESLTECIIRIYRDKDLSFRLGKAARKKVIEQFDWRMYNKRIFDRLQIIK